MLKNCILILPVSDPAKQAAQVVKHHVFEERTVITLLEETPGDKSLERSMFSLNDSKTLTS
jgi:hypothetical protein